MPKRWRRSASIAGAPAVGMPPIAPLILGVAVQAGGDYYEVSFDQPIDSSSVTGCAMSVGDGGSHSWAGNISPTSLELDCDPGAGLAGVAWNYAGGDNLVPAPASPQAGVTT